MRARLDLSVFFAEYCYAVFLTNVAPWHVHGLGLLIRIKLTSTEGLCSTKRLLDGLDFRSNILPIFIRIFIVFIVKKPFDLIRGLLI